MAESAAEAQQAAVLDLEQGAVTLRTAESGRLTSGLVLGRHGQPSPLHSRHDKVRDRNLLRRNCRGAAEPGDYRTELAGTGDLSDLDVLDRRFRHARVGR